jgi:hypothetical protein
MPVKRRAYAATDTATDTPITTTTPTNPSSAPEARRPQLIVLLVVQVHLKNQRGEIG